MNRDAIPKVVKTEPAWIGEKCKVDVRYPKIEINHEPQMKNCKKLRMVRRVLIPIVSFI
jgi:hypothetical protein